MEIRSNPIVRALIGAPWLFIWSFAIYILATTVRPFPNSVVSHLAFYGFLCFFDFFWLWIFDTTFRARSFVIQPGFIDQCDTVLFVFRFHQRYVPKDVKEFISEYRSGVMTGGHDALLVTCTGKKIDLQRFNSKTKADDFCRQVRDVFYGEAEGQLG